MGLRQILVNRNTVERNQETGENEPVFRILDDHGGEHFGSDLILTGPSAVRYDSAAPVGSRIWIETWDKVIVKTGTDMEPV